MGRLPGKPREELEEPGRRVWDGLVESRGGQTVGEDGALHGPFNAWVQAPSIGAWLSGLGHALRFETSLDRRLIELAVITVGAHWQAEFEWWAHSRMARQHGVAEPVIDAIRDGTPVPLVDEPDRVVHAVASELAGTGRLGQATYDSARTLLGDQGLIELVTLCGYYTLVSMTLNAFEVDLPRGADPVWPA
jgi:4-carboxymuconolactone decarboxylase